MYGSIHSSKMVLNFSKRANIYKNTTGSLTFNPETKEAVSYGWWKFVAMIDGQLVFNNYAYSNTTAKQQGKIRTLLSQLNIKIDLELPVPKGLQVYSTLEEVIEASELHLCDKFVSEQLKRQDQYQKAKARKLKAKLEDYLENQVHFRDYDIMAKARFGSVNKIAVHQVVDAESLERDVENALHSFSRDGFGSVVFYIEGI